MGGLLRAGARPEHTLPLARIHRAPQAPARRGGCTVRGSRGRPAQAFAASPLSYELRFGGGRIDPPGGGCAGSHQLYIEGPHGGRYPRRGAGNGTRAVGIPLRRVGGGRGTLYGRESRRGGAPSLRAPARGTYPRGGGASGFSFHRCLYIRSYRRADDPRPLSAEDIRSGSLAWLERRVQADGPAARGGSYREA